MSFNLNDHTVFALNLAVMNCSWTYKQSTGELSHNGAYIGKGYAGKGSHKNKPDDQCIRNEGPLPRGCYTIGPAYQHAKLGPVTMNLDNSDGHDMCGRDLFRIHGDSINDPGNASDGCIILNRTIRDQISASTDRTLCVVR